MGWIRKMTETLMPILTEDGFRRQVTYEELEQIGSADYQSLARNMLRRFPRLYTQHRPEDVISIDLLALVAQGRVQTTGAKCTKYEVL